MVNIKNGLTNTDLEILLKPIFGMLTDITINWIHNDQDAVIMINHVKRPSTTNTNVLTQQKLPPDQLEEMLEDCCPRIEDKFVNNEWATEVRCVWINSDMEVAEPKKNNENTFTPLSKRKQPVLPSNALEIEDNIWEVLNRNEGNNSKKTTTTNIDPWEEGESVNNKSNSENNGKPLLEQLDDFDNWESGFEGNQYKEKPSSNGNGKLSNDVEMNSLLELEIYGEIRSKPTTTSLNNRDKNGKTSSNSTTNSNESQKDDDVVNDWMELLDD